MSSITGWQRRVHELNISKGFYDYQKDLALIEQLIEFTEPLVGEEDVVMKCLKRVIADYKQALIERKLFLAVGELCEAHNELRNGHAVDEVYYNEGSDKPEGFPIEIADAHIRLLDIAEASDFETEINIEEKHQYNTTRPFKHGKQF